MYLVIANFILLFKMYIKMSDGSVRNLTRRPAIPMKLYGHLHYFYYIHKKWSKKLW